MVQHAGVSAMKLFEDICRLLPRMKSQLFRVPCRQFGTSSQNLPFALYHKWDDVITIPEFLAETGVIYDYKVKWFN